MIQFCNYIIRFEVACLLLVWFITSIQMRSCDWTNLFIMNKSCQVENKDQKKIVILLWFDITLFKTMNSKFVKASWFCIKTLYKTQDCSIWTDISSHGSSRILQLDVNSDSALVFNFLCTLSVSLLVYLCIS